MNERIKQLVKQAGLDDDMFPIDEWDNPELEKFAELIVRECIEQCSANDSNDEWDKGVRWAANQIKEHFGVEE
jgi:hypothetical protein